MPNLIEQTPHISGAIVLRQWAIEQAIASGSSGQNVVFDARWIMAYVLGVPSLPERDSTAP